MNASYKDIIRGEMISNNRLPREITHKMHPGLYEHLGRVELYVYLFCIQMAVNSSPEIQLSSCAAWGKAAFFHDIGKIEISETILMKPDKLSATEMAIMREHPIYAKDILLQLSTAEYFPNDPEFFSLAVLAALFHHEWWNGKGYPFGIAGEAIPLIARITSICDAFDTITDGRPYRGARSADDALRKIGACADSQFDPKLSAFFIEHKNAFLN